VGEAELVVGLRELRGEIAVGGGRAGYRGSICGCGSREIGIGIMVAGLFGGDLRIKKVLVGFSKESLET
jgi:hypothetical protein